MIRKMTKKGALSALAGLTKVTGKTTKKSTVKLKVDGHQALVDEIVKRQRELESLGTEQKAALEELRQIGVEAMREQESWQFTKTCRVHGDLQDVRVTRKDAFSKIDPEHEDALKGMLGDVYETLFSAGTDLKLIVEPGNFIAACRKAKLDVDKYFDRTDWIKPKKGFLEVRASLRGGMKGPDNEVLDALTDKFAHAATVGFKG